ncbi:MAG: heme A synthase [bacterium]|nr:heme A synthase [bacterium]
MAPFCALDWQGVFQKYQQIPEYAQINAGMSLDQFKRIFWWEWSHRALGRLIGIALVLPWIVFSLMGAIPKSLQLKLIVMLLLGGLQGVLGWYMVKSGLVDRVDVSQYRLAVQLLMAGFIFGFILWVALDLTPARNFQLVLPLETRDVVMAGALVGLLLAQIGLGALVAGLHAGLSHNTWPFMDGDFIPGGLFLLDPMIVNLFENVLTVQFNHRMLAYVILLLAFVHGFLVIRKSDGIIKSSAIIVLFTLLFQVVLGIAVLLLVVPFSLAFAHQALAFIALAAAVRHLYLIQSAR